MNLSQEFVGKIVYHPCPLCENPVVFQEPVAAEAPTKYYCHGCNKGFDCLLCGGNCTEIMNCIKKELNK